MIAKPIKIFDQNLAYKQNLLFLMKKNYKIVKLLTNF